MTGGPNEAERWQTGPNGTERGQTGITGAEQEHYLLQVLLPFIPMPANPLHLNLSPLLCQSDYRLNVSVIMV